MSTTQRPSGLSVVEYKKSSPGLPPTGGVYGGGGGFQPLWTSGDQSDIYGYRDGAYPQVTFDVLYRTQPWIAAVVNKLVRQIARTPIKVYRPRDGDKERIRVDSNDPGASLVRLLGRPTPRKSGIHLKQWMARPLMVFGNSLLAKYYGDSPDFPPTELIPMDWRCVEAFAQPGGDVEMWRTTQVGDVRLIDYTSTVHTAWDADGCIGVSPLEQLAITMRLEDAAQRLSTAAFRNASRPSGGIALPAGSNPNKAQLDMMRESVEAMHRGVDNAFKVALLAPGAQWVPMMFSMAENEMMAMRQFNREEVCAVYDVKPSQVGALSTPGAGYSSVVEVNRDLYRTTLPPWFTLIEETIESQLIEPEPMWEGLKVEFETREMLQGDPEVVAGMLATQLQTFQLTPNEARDVNNQPRLEDPAADQLYGPLGNNLVPLGTPPPEPVQQQLPIEPLP